MKYGIYAIYDKKAYSFGPPMNFPTDIHALRAFKAQIEDPEMTNAIAQYPGDFQLHKIGSMVLDSDDNGNIITNITATDQTLLYEGLVAKQNFNKEK